MADNNSAILINRTTSATGRRHALRWALLGVLLGAMLTALFLAYGQPELLLEQMNLRYCG